MYLFTLAQLACSFVIKMHYKITYYIFREKKKGYPIHVANKAQHQNFSFTDSLCLCYVV